MLGPPLASGRSLVVPSSQKFSARQGNAREKGMISMRTIETFVSMSVVIRDKQKYGIRRIICKYGQGNSWVRTTRKYLAELKTN